MTQYIDKAAVVAEIERLEAFYHVSEDLGARLIIEGLFRFINTLEVKEVKSEEIKTPRWFLENIENTLRIQYNINLEKKGETCQDRNIKESLNGVRKLLHGEELTGGERTEELIQYASEVKEVDLDNNTIMEEIRKCGCYPNEFDIAKHFFELGLNTKKEK